MPAQAAQSSQDQAAHAPVIIKRVKKRGHEHHHGGAWKVAYADFVTAMMAFFLLLWLLNATTEEQKVAISNYFAPESVSRSESGAGGVLGGMSMTEDGAMPRPASPEGLVIPMVSTPSGEAHEGETAQRPDETYNPADAERARDGDVAANEAWMPQREAGGGANLGHAPEADIAAEDPGGDARIAALEAARAAERETFRAVAAEIRKAFEGSPELRAYADNILVKETDLGLEIQVIDQEKVSMFSRGSAVMYDHAKAIISTVSEVIRGMPDHRIAITGHTDATQYSDPAGYSNWELSTDRAHAARRTMIGFGVDSHRIVQVVGKADRELLIPANPEDARNRRISFVLIRNVPAPTSDDG